MILDVNCVYCHLTIHKLMNEFNTKLYFNYFPCQLPCPEQIWTIISLPPNISEPQKLAHSDHASSGYFAHHYGNSAGYFHTVINISTNNSISISKGWQCVMIKTLALVRIRPWSCWNLFYVLSMYLIVLLILLTVTIRVSSHKYIEHYGGEKRVNIH